MTGLHDKRATSESRRSKRPERSRPEAKVAEPPARRAKRAEGHVPLRKRESARVGRPPHPLDSEDVTAEPRPARRDERSSSPLCGDGGTEEITMAPPPPSARTPLTRLAPPTCSATAESRMPATPSPPPLRASTKGKLSWISHAYPRGNLSELNFGMPQHVRARVWNATTA
uniref:Uncharacterized protein n=1 Tax=Triticum urartu TaxID=4572 RepID=A0A8R7QUJ3_TRIUA